MPASESSLRITEAYRARLFGLRSQLERRAETLWPTIEGLDDFTWTNKAAAATQNAQREAVALTGAYLTAFLSSEVGTRTRGPILDTRRYSGLSRDGRPLTDALRSPMIGVRFKLKEGATPEEALAYGLNRAKRMVSVDYDHAHRTALLDGLAADERFQGWQRAVTGTCGACAGDIAVEVSTNLPSIPLQVHPNCQCVTEPVVTPRSPAEALREVAAEVSEQLRGYVANPHSFSINKYLRDPGTTEGTIALRGPQLQAEVDALDEVLTAAGPIGSPVRAFRGVAGSPDEVFGGSIEGKTLVERAFSSTTGDQFIASHAASRSRRVASTTTEAAEDMVWTLDIDPSVKGVWGANPGEAELLLERGCRYVIESVRREGKTWQIKAKVLPPE